MIQRMGRLAIKNAVNLMMRRFPTLSANFPQRPIVKMLAQVTAAMRMVIGQVIELEVAQHEHRKNGGGDVDAELEQGDKDRELAKFDSRIFTRKPDEAEGVLFRTLIPGSYMRARKYQEASLQRNADEKMITKARQLVCL